jgi:hypothetical protein
MGVFIKHRNLSLTCKALQQQEGQLEIPTTRKQTTKVTRPQKHTYTFFANYYSQLMIFGIIKKN